ncbi:L-alanine-DL-glutamate epimerase [Fodinibius salinus]|uniref:Dipeptide epimerase n=1 Tax=Fodinibius salinus TaxID=860790 RepID=A0A5D3YF54_9BACT|nr:dipeptide epimerase [Fodinibius salinus]TYP91666.1 L-alanine-DL-glutamate epimerase [Fodinibius salinus]
MSHFRLLCEPLELELAHPFTIARGTKKSVRNVMVTLSADGFTGYGEAAPNSRYGEDAEKVLGYLKNIPDNFFDDVQSADELVSKLGDYNRSVKSAQAAVEMAWLDWWAKSKGQSLWSLWQAPSNSTPPTSYTIALDTIDIMQQKVQEAKEFPILKVKLGTDRDRKIIEAIRSVTDKPIRVDANEGWTDLETAKNHIAFLANQNIELVEQPMPSDLDNQMKELYDWSPLPLIADERFTGSESLSEIAQMFDGINIKLAKIGSLTKVKTVLSEALKQDLQVMVGCMIESTLGIAAGALLGTWADYIDLDGHLLISDDPFEGLELTDDKQLCLGNAPGLGITKK